MNEIRSDTDRSTRPAPAWVAVLFLGFVVAGILLVAHGVRSIQLNAESSGWPTTNGTVVGSTVESRPGMRQDRTTYRPIVEYTYVVDGRAHAGDRIRFGELEGPDEQAARRIAERYVAGAEVTVRYDPDHPRESVLEPGSTEFESTIAMGIGMLTLLGLCLGVVLWHRSRTGREAVGVHGSA